jgi:hypothetical protein
MTTSLLGRCVALEWGLTHVSRLVLGLFHKSPWYACLLA